ncbi:hypothetical protein LPJ71_008440, partial [Coemansia sp. S17]
MSPPPAIESSSLGKWSEPIHRVCMMLQQPLDLGAQSRYPTIPSLPEWRHLWSAWDTLVLHIIPRRCLHDRPIDLRHPFIFYLGHVPAFADIHMAAAEKAPLTEPQSYAQWFERGIDPNIENLSICHSHSEVPKEWPLLDDILAYRDRVRARFTNWLDAYERGGRRAEVGAARRVWMAFEHEALHFETLLYMVLQMKPGDIQPPIEASFAPLGGRQPRESWVRYAGGSDLVFGLAGDNESEMQGQELPSRHVFGWDNESPQIRISLKPFSIRSQPITNGEYLAFLQTLSGSSESVDGLVPQSWVSLDQEPALTGDYGVRTVVGTPSITTTEAAMWPVCVSQKQANAYAKWSGKRLPTEAEWIHASRTYHLARALATGDRKAGFAASKSIDRVLGQEMNPGSVQEILQQPYDMFVPSDANVDLASWHPQPVIADGAMFIGNAWEWTSTQFYPYDGFKPSAMYPGYSADFFDPISDHAPDSTHYVVKGGSYATHRRIAHRQTFRNWYQRGYPYVLATFRLVDE